jgi:hypothetical protein
MTRRGESLPLRADFLRREVVRKWLYLARLEADLRESRMLVFAGLDHFKLLLENNLRSDDVSPKR